MNDDPPPDSWSSGDAYDAFIGRWSRLVAAAFVNWLSLPPGARCLDIGCGTGALTSAILASGAPRSVDGVDPSPEYAAFAGSVVVDPRAHFRVGDALALDATPGMYDVVVSGLVLNFVPDPAAALGEMVRVASPGGVVAAYVWDYAGQMQLIRYFWDAAVALDPPARGLDEAIRFPICNPVALGTLWLGVGLKSVETAALDVPTVFTDFADYWSPFLGGQGPAPGYAMSLTATRRKRLRERLRATLPVAEGGTVRLTARAWAVRGTVTPDTPGQ